MSERNLKQTMEQIHISEEMQEEIIRNVRHRMENGNGKGKGKRKGKTEAEIRKRLVAAAAVLVAVAGIVSVPARSTVKDIVNERMEQIPKEEIQAIAEMLRVQQSEEAASVSREYTDQEQARMKELRQAYRSGTFPEKEILRVDTADGMPEGTLCYVISTGTFYLPERELTDEEILEILDLENKIRYAVEQSPAGQEVRQEYQAKQAQLGQKVWESGGISRARAEEIALERAAGEPGVSVEKLELQRISLTEVSYDGNRKAIVYEAYYWNPDEGGWYGCEIDAMDGSILKVESWGKKDKND